VAKKIFEYFLKQGERLSTCDARNRQIFFYLKLTHVFMYSSGKASTLSSFSAIVENYLFGTEKLDLPQQRHLLTKISTLFKTFFFGGGGNKKKL
jgi:hypothetical protein